MFIIIFGGLRSNVACILQFVKNWSTWLSDVHMLSTIMPQLLENLESSSRYQCSVKLIIHIYGE